jgi:hypothetical protein
MAIRRRSETVVAAEHGAVARTVDGQYLEESDQGEEAVHLAAVAASDREPAVLEAELLMSVDEKVYPG